MTGEGIREEGIPSVLYHKVYAFNPELVPAALVDIRKVGLLPQKPSEYKISLPKELQETPVVWLAGRMFSSIGAILGIKTVGLDLRKLFKLDWDDVDWYIYQGYIAPNLIEEVMNGK